MKPKLETWTYYVNMYHECAGNWFTSLAEAKEMTKEDGVMGTLKIVVDYVNDDEGTIRSAELIKD